jgi:hypothetical protein
MPAKFTTFLTASSYTQEQHTMNRTSQPDPDICPAERQGSRMTRTAIRRIARISAYYRAGCGTVSWCASRSCCLDQAASML